jgi:predicted nucleotide-binding protein
MSEKPRLFIASSTEAIKIADFIEERLKNVADVVTWKSAFDLGDVTIDTLFHELNYSDYAVLIATADDKVITRTI